MTRDNKTAIILDWQLVTGNDDEAEEEYRRYYMIPKAIMEHLEEHQ